MERRDRLSHAVDYAIDSNYIVYEKQLHLFDKLVNSENVCIFGAGRFFREAYPYIRSIIHAQYITDNNVDSLTDIPEDLMCISPETLYQMKTSVVLIMVADYTAIQKQLDQMEIENYYIGEITRNMYTVRHSSEWFKNNKKDILAVYDLLEDDDSREVYVQAICYRIAPQYCKTTFVQLQDSSEYFRSDIWKMTEQECFVDVGAYVGDTIQSFIEYVDNKYEKITAFELDDDIYEVLLSFVEKSKFSNVRLVHKGIGQKTEVMKYQDAAIGAVYNENGSKEAEFTCIDDTFKNEKVTMIKMDIEGAEQQAITGSKNVMIQQGPKLAICVYHNLEDLWQIPLEIKEIDPEYHVFMRHHSPTAWDTVCYAVKRD